MRGQIWGTMGKREQGGPSIGNNGDLKIEYNGEVGQWGDGAQQ